MVLNISKAKQIKFGNKSNYIYFFVFNFNSDSQKPEFWIIHKKTEFWIIHKNFEWFEIYVAGCFQQIMWKCWWIFCLLKLKI